jgi:hypothetical protein
MGARALYRIQIEDDDEVETAIDADTRDILHWERTGENRNASLLGTGRFDLIYSLAYTAAKRRGIFTGSLVDFENRYVIVKAEEIISETGAPDEGGPTRADPSTET